ncbi:MAG: hypothetical protein WA005_16110 [Candidatus Binataceae bacterium]
MRPVLFVVALFLLGGAFTKAPYGGTANAAEPLFQAGEAGLTIQWIPNRPSAANPISLSGATVVMRALKYPGGTATSLSCVVAGDGLSATYTMASTDFPAPGIYQLQFVATLSSSSIRKSPVRQIEVGESL